MRHKETHVLRTQLVSGLKKQNFSEIVPGIANFVMFHMPPAGPDAGAVVSDCRKHGLFLRDIRTMGSTLGCDVLRIAVKDQATNRRMLEIIGEAINHAVCKR
jgi:histidinol-phosphate/aromatic aminotransferase/cobyric acid decarboxylase-like protein